MELKAKVSRVNIYSLFLISFVVAIVLYIKTSIVPYLLVAHYGIS